MNQKNTAVLVGGGIFIALFAGLVGFLTGQQSGFEGQKMSQTSFKMEKVNHTEMSMTEMTDGLKGKTGEEFDRAFVEMMIVHHEGAVEMAKLIESSTKRDELRRLGQAIITAQTEEIAQMRKWLKDWGLEQRENMHDMMH